MIDWKLIELPNNKRGEVQTTCPSCSHTRTKKKDKCLSVNVDKGQGFCHHCAEISIRDIVEKKEYKLPPQEWQNYTKLPDNLVKYLISRGISQQTAIECKITHEEYYQPSEGKIMANIVFNYLEGNKLVNKKFRSSKKQFTQIKDAKKIFYGINDIVGQKSIYIVEGEFDKLALWEVGVKNCISVPNGANDMNDVFENCENYVKDVEKVYIAVDMDEAGLRLENEIVKRFGKWRCERIEFIGKDANEDLKNDKLQLIETLKKSKPYPVEGTYNANDVSNDIDYLYENGLDKTIKPKGDHWKEFNKIFSILRGQLTVITGIPSHGKSNLTEYYMLELVNDNSLKCSFYSPEHMPMQLHHSVLAEKVIGKPFHKMDNYQRMTQDEVNQYKEWSSDKIYLTTGDKGNMIDWDWLLEKFKEQIFRYGIDLFVIDAFNKVKRKNTDSLGEIGDVLARLTLFVQAYDVNIFLIAHPTKMRKDEKTGQYIAPTLYDVKGSGDFRDQAHNGLCVHRYFDDNNEKGMPHVEVTNLKTKFRHQGDIGATCHFTFSPLNGRYGSFGNGVPMNSIIMKEETKDVFRNSTIDYFENEINTTEAPF